MAPRAAVGAGELAGSPGDVLIHSESSVPACCWYIHVGAGAGPAWVMCVRGRYARPCVHLLTGHPSAPPSRPVPGAGKPAGLLGSGCTHETRLPAGTGALGVDRSLVGQAWGVRGSRSLLEHILVSVV